jgi:uroporphyrinogen III methyltransferase/synthase
MTEELRGKRILIPRAEGQGDGPARLLRERGAEPVVIPAIAIGPADDERPLRKALAHLADFAWVVFTSANGVEHTWRVLGELGLGAAALAPKRIAVVGTATRDAVVSHGAKVSVVAREQRGKGLAEALLDAMNDQPDEPRAVLILAAQEASETLPRALEGAGVPFMAVAAYRTRPFAPGAAEIARQLGAGLLDAIVFSSGSTVDSVCDALGADAPALLEAVTVACIGPVTEERAKARGIGVDVVPRTPTFASVADALALHFSR